VEFEHYAKSVQQTWIENACDHAGNNGDPEWKELEISGQNAAGFGVREVLRGQNTLYAHLQIQPLLLSSSTETHTLLSLIKSESGILVK